MFWLWAAAILGCSIKYAEIYFGQSKKGGAMAYIREALGNVPARVYALLAALSALLVGNMAQMNGAITALCGVIGPEASVLRAGLGLLFTLFLALQLEGGAGQIGRFCEKLIPLMTLGYVITLGWVLIVFRARLPEVFDRILSEAFTLRALAGGTGALATRQAMLWGFRRGAFSNEAGLGTAANIHAQSGTGRPGRDALWGIAEVLIDTVLLCTMTALTILCSGAAIPYGTLPGPELLQMALSSVYGIHEAYFMVAAALTLFGFSTVLGCYVSGAGCAKWLLGPSGAKAYRMLYLICAFLGALIPVGLIWQAADAVNVLLAAPNLLALLLLAPGLGKEKQGKKHCEPLTSKGKLIY